jgi:hypothetical protein
MANLSIVKNGGGDKTLATTIASPIFPLAPHEHPKTGANVAFEVLEKDALGLHALIGQTNDAVRDRREPILGDAEGIEVVHKHASGT